MGQPEKSVAAELPIGVLGVKKLMPFFKKPRIVCFNCLEVLVGLSEIQTSRTGFHLAASLGRLEG